MTEAQDEPVVWEKVPQRTDAAVWRTLWRKFMAHIDQLSPACHVCYVYDAASEDVIPGGVTVGTLVGAQLLCEVVLRGLVAQQELADIRMHLHNAQAVGHGLRRQLDLLWGLSESPGVAEK